MASEVQPQPGDKIEITFTRQAVVREVDDDGGLHLTYPNGLGVYFEPGRDEFTVRILERADDPSRDGIGVWRQDDPENGGNIFRKTGLVEGPWLSPYTGEYRTDGQMRGSVRVQVTVTGAVPGTPAAEAADYAKINEAIAQLDPIKCPCGQCSALPHRPHREDCPEVVGP